MSQDKRDALVRGLKAWWTTPYWEVSCIRHGTMQMAKARAVDEEHPLADRCPLCGSFMERYLVEPPAEQRLRRA